MLLLTKIHIIPCQTGETYGMMMDPGVNINVGFYPNSVSTNLVVMASLWKPVACPKLMNISSTLNMSLWKRKPFNVDLETQPLHHHSIICSPAVNINVSCFPSESTSLVVIAMIDDDRSKGGATQQLTTTTMATTTPAPTPIPTPTPTQTMQTIIK